MREEVCTIYTATVTQLAPRHLALLDEVERGRHRAYVRHEDRARFALGAVLVRLIAASRLGVAPDRVSVDRTCTTCGESHGRPRLPGSEVHVSVTHSGALVAVAVTGAGPVGVDLELIRPFDHSSLLEEVLAPEERQHRVDTTPFFTYWTRKEAVLKATGAGLTIPMRSVVVTPPQRPPRLLRYPDRPPDDVWMIDISPATGYVGAAAVFSRTPVSFHACGAADLLSQC